MAKSFHWKFFPLSGVQAGAYSIDDVKSAVLTFAGDNPAGTLYLLSVSSGSAVLTVLGKKALENRPKKVSLPLNDTDYIAAPSMQALLAFENFLCCHTLLMIKLIVQRASKSLVKEILVLTWSPIVFLKSQTCNSQGRPLSSRTNNYCTKICGRAVS